MALYPSRYSMLPEDYEFDGLLSPYVEPPVYAAPEPVYPFTNPWQDMGYTPDQGLLAPTATPTPTPTAYPDAGQQVPQVQTAAPQVQAAPRQGNWSPVYYDDIGSYFKYNGGVNWAALPGSEVFINPATGGGDNYQEEGINASALQDYIAQNGYTFQEDSLGDNRFVRYAIDRDGNTVEASRLEGRHETWSEFFKDAAKLAAVMGTAYLGGTALAGMGGTGAAAGAGAGAGAGGISAADAALAMGMGETAVGGTTLGTAGTVASTLAPEVIASTVAPEVAGSGLLAPSAGQTITITGAAKAAAAAPWWAPVATAATALPIINSLTTPSTPTPDVPDPYANETNKLQRQGQQPGGDLGNMGGPGTPEIPTIDVSPSPLDQLKAWAQANPQLAKMMFTGASSLLSASGGGGDSKGGYVDSGYRPTISRGGFQARVPTTPYTPTTGPTGLLNPSIRPVTLPSTGQANDGLWRYGLLGPGRG